MKLIKAETRNKFFEKRISSHLNAASELSKKFLKFSAIKGKKFVISVAIILSSIMNLQAGIGDKIDPNVRGIINKVRTEQIMTNKDANIFREAMNNLEKEVQDDIGKHQHIIAKQFLWEYMKMAEAFDDMNLRNKIHDLIEIIDNDFVVKLVEKKIPNGIYRFNGELIIVTYATGYEGKAFNQANDARKYLLKKFNTKNGTNAKSKQINYSYSIKANDIVLVEKVDTNVDSSRYPNLSL